MHIRYVQNLSAVVRIFHGRPECTVALRSIQSLPKGSLASEEPTANGAVDHADVLSCGSRNMVEG
jgi:hypothetical protein